MSRGCQTTSPGDEASRVKHGDEMKVWRVFFIGVSSPPQK